VAAREDGVLDRRAIARVQVVAELGDADLFDGPRAAVEPLTFCTTLCTFYRDYFREYLWECTGLCRNASAARSSSCLELHPRLERRLATYR
jgi:hypothetical protein